MLISSDMREQVRERANYVCEYCYRPENIMGQEFEIDHIVPQSKEGMSVLDNLCLACRACNGHKLASVTGIDPETNLEIALYNPRTQIWSKHFRWHEDYTIIEGVTDVGRATVNRLQVNKDIIIMARKRWRTIGWHPEKI